jgi:glutamine amidotransferase
MSLAEIRSRYQPADDRRHAPATTWGDTLSYLQTPAGVVVASESWDDDPGWRDIPDHHLLQVIGERITLTELEKPS